MKVSLAMVFVILAAGSIATAAAGKTLSESLGVLFRFPGVALMTFAWMTVVFSALEFFGARLRLRDRWDPRLLPPLVKTEPRKSQFELIAQTGHPDAVRYMVAGRTALPIPHLRAGHRRPQIRPGVANDLSIVCGHGDR